jgi:hypothetical protein
MNTQPLHKRSATARPLNRNYVKLNLGSPRESDDGHGRPSGIWLFEVLAIDFVDLREISDVGKEYCDLHDMREILSSRSQDSRSILEDLFCLFDDPASYELS